MMCRHILWSAYSSSFFSWEVSGLSLFSAFRSKNMIIRSSFWEGGKANNNNNKAFRRCKNGNIVVFGCQHIRFLQSIIMEGACLPMRRFQQVDPLWKLDFSACCLIIMSPISVNIILQMLLQYYLSNCVWFLAGFNLVCKLSKFLCHSRVYNTRIVLAKERFWADPNPQNSKPLALYWIKEFLSPLASDSSNGNTSLTEIWGVTGLIDFADYSLWTNAFPFIAH